MAVEIKGRPLDGDVIESPEWHGLLRTRRAMGIPFALLFSPGRCVLVDAEDRTHVFSGQDVLDTYKIQELPLFQPEHIVETVLYNWLTDLTLGIARPLPPGFPKLAGDEVRRAA